MKKLGTLSFFCIALLTASTTLYSATIERSGTADTDERGNQALREWININRQISIKELGGALAISGEVRTEFQSTNETVNGIRQRGAGGATRLNSRAYDIEVNLMLDYRAERTWAAIKLEFDNDAGIFSGTLNKLKLEKAYFGGRAFKYDTWNIDFEIGRRKLSMILDSKLEFSSFFDGIWIKYDHAFESVADIYVHAGPFIINERNDHYGYVGEVGILDVLDSGFYTKYSLIDWDTKDFDDPINRHRFDFIVSQLLFGYKFKICNRIYLLYLAGLLNHAAHKLAISDYKRANWGGYVGFSIGELKKKGDWALDVNYQALAAQAVPDWDVLGIGLGNAPNAGFYTTNIDGLGSPTTRKTAAGNGNYRGFVITLDYLITNNLNFEQQYQQSITLDTHIGPFRRFKQYEIEFIYGF